MQVIGWLGLDWAKFDENIIYRSFDQCGILSRHNLHTTLRQILETNQRGGAYVDDLRDEDELAGFDGYGAHNPNEVESVIMANETESEISDVSSDDEDDNLRAVLAPGAIREDPNDSDFIFDEDDDTDTFSSEEEDEERLIDFL